MVLCAKLRPMLRVQGACVRLLAELLANVVDKVV